MRPGDGKDRSVNEGLQRYLELASGLTRTTLGTTERMLAGFVRQGEVAAEHAERLLDEIVARSVEGSGALARLVTSEVEQAVERAGYARAEEVDELRHEVEALRARLAAINGDLHDAGTEAP
jgi:polyhydroxyalkanoate synthesis regulator phasin